MGLYLLPLLWYVFCECNLPTGARYWELTGSERYPVAGRPLTDAGLPRDVDRLDAAFVWGHNRRAYVITGTMYWKLVADPQRTLVEGHTYPRDMSMWAGVPIPVDGALTYTNGMLLFTILSQYHRCFVD